MSDEFRIDRRTATHRAKRPRVRARNIWNRSPPIWTTAESFPKAIVEQLAAHDFLGLLLPEDVGGAGAGFVSYIQVVEALSRFCPAIASILNNHVLAAHAIVTWGSEPEDRASAAAGQGHASGTLAIYENGPAPGIGPDALVASRQDGSMS